MGRVIILFIALFALVSKADSLVIDDIEFFIEEPSIYTSDSQIMVLFGGKNWEGDRSLKTFDFKDLANKHSLFLISPSFKDRDYWEPQEWSGTVLKKAIKALESKYNLKSQKLFFYGYSAGGQSANLFYDYMPEQVEAWALHACGVYPEKVNHSQAPALITCGVEDTPRLQISKTFIYKYRENGGDLILKYYNAGHKLNPEALEIAKEFFDTILRKEPIKYIGEDDTMQVVEPHKTKSINIEFRNPLYSETLKELWLKE